MILILREGLLLEPTEAASTKADKQAELAGVVARHEAFIDERTAVIADAKTPAEKVAEINAEVDEAATNHDTQVAALQSDIVKCQSEITTLEVLLVPKVYKDYMTILFEPPIGVIREFNVPYTGEDISLTAIHTAATLYLIAQGIPATNITTEI